MSNWTNDVEHCDVSQCTREQLVAEVHRLQNELRVLRASPTDTSTPSLSPSGVHAIPRLSLETVMDVAPVALIIARASDQVLEYLNPAALEILGHRGAPSLLNLPLSRMAECQTWQELDANGAPILPEERPLARALRGETTTSELQIRRADGTVRLLFVSAMPIYGNVGEIKTAVASFRDITELKAATLQLQQLLNEQRTILHTLKIGIAFLKNRRLQWANPAFAAMFGYSADELANFESSRFYAQYSDFERVGQEGYAQLARGELYSTEALMRRSDGGTFLCAIYGQAVIPERLDEGTVWALQDISERKRWEDDLHRSERKLAEIFRASPEMIVVSRAADGVILELNEEFSRLMGYQHADVIGRSGLEVNLWPDAQSRSSALSQFQGETPPRNIETQMRTRSGALVDVLLSIASLSIDGEDTLIWLATDISERKRAEQALRESESRFKRLVANSNDLIVVLDLTGRVLLIVGPLMSKYGYDADAVVGRLAEEFLHPDDADEYRRALVALLSHEGSTRRIEARLRTQTGGYIPIEAAATNCLAEPNVGGIVFNVRDVSERKQAEKEHLKLQAQLQQAMKMEAVGRLAGGVAHDFNNLLTVITGNIDLLQIGSEVSDSGRVLLQEIGKAAESAASLTRQLLAFSRRQIIEPRNVNLNELVADLQKMLGRLIGENISVGVNLFEPLGIVRIDPGQFEQVVVNLVVNARDAMPNGGRLVIETANVDLDEHYVELHPGVKPGRYVQLAVSDSGQGMDESTMQVLFEPFYTTKPRGKGTGLGLAMIFGAVKQSGGNIEVYSEVNRGSTFKIYLPCVEATAERLERRTCAPEVPKGTEAILLVEDDPSVRKLALGLLRKLGYDVQAAADGAEALELAQSVKKPFDLLMTDVVMPGMNGKELASRLRQIFPEMGVLFTSGYTENVIVHHGILGEHLDFLSKPYSIQALANKLREMLQARHDARAPSV